VRLRVWRDGGWAEAAVIDRGRGIPREELDRIFEKFHRVEDPMTMTTGGTGLGLYIARELTRAMGGEIEAASAPAAAPPSPSACRSPPSTPRSRYPRPRRGERTDAGELRAPAPKRPRAEDPLVRTS
jgi:signal transduction histidine kinase